MSVVRALPFYDPHLKHTKLPVGQDIQFFYILNVLLCSLSNDIDILRVVCLCSDDQSTVIDQVQDLAPVIAVWSCQEHYGREKNPTFSKKVRDDLVFHSDGYKLLKWQFEAHKLLLAPYRMNINRDRYKKQLDILIGIKRQSSYESQDSVDATDQPDVETDDVRWSEESE